MYCVYIKIKMMFTWNDATHVATEWQTIATCLLIGYIPFVFVLQFAMKYIKPFDLHTPLQIWNCSLSALSFYGFSILVPRLFDVDFVHSITSLDYGSGMSGYIVYLFNVSKLIEMVDTVFLVVRKKQLTFLHVFHHLTVAIYCYSTLFDGTALGYWYATMNTFVHGVMYGYFAFDKQIKTYTNFNPMYLTILQIVQMAWGVSLNVLYLIQPTTVFGVSTMYHTIYGLGMYGSYLYMFCAFFDTKYTFKTPVNWFTCFYILGVHILAVFGWLRCSWMEFGQVFIAYQLCGLGVTVGMHRLWSHRSFKAKTPTRFMLMLLASICNQGTVFHWCRDHRVHHKFSDTVADPHDITRGFFYAHLGWVMLRKDKPVKDAGTQLDCSDLMDDWVVVLNHKLNPIWNPFWCFVVPGLFGMWRYNSFFNGFVIFGALRYVMTLHATMCVNSVAHTMGSRPYVDIKPCESPITSLVACGEGWHNWHHAFPFDYAASQDGVLLQWNPSKFVIDCLSGIGQIYDRKRHIVRPNSLIPSKDVPGDQHATRRD
jgi:stearoyl-CoA desaturase (delta-9 desaturase)